MAKTEKGHGNRWKLQVKLPPVSTSLTTQISNYYCLLQSCIFSFAVLHFDMGNGI